MGHLGDVWEGHQRQNLHKSGSVGCAWRLSMGFVRSFGGRSRHCLVHESDAWPVGAMGPAQRPRRGRPGKNPESIVSTGGVIYDCLACFRRLHKRHPAHTATGNFHYSAGIISWDQENGIARRALGYDLLKIPFTHWSRDVDLLMVAWRLFVGLRSSSVKLPAQVLVGTLQSKLRE